MASIRVLPCLTATVLRSSASRTSRSASSRCDCFDIVALLPRWRHGPKYNWRNRQCAFAAYFRCSVLPRQSRAANAPVPMQPLNCDLQRAVLSAFRTAGQRVETHWKNASEQVVAIVQMPASPCAAASPEAAAARNAANTIQRHLSTGTNPLAFFAIMGCNYACHRLFTIALGPRQKDADADPPLSPRRLRRAGRRRRSGRRRGAAGRQAGAGPLSLQDRRVRADRAL